MSMKEAYVEKIQARLNQWDTEIENLKSKAAEASADAKIEYERQVDELQGMQKETQAKLDELRAAGDDAWTDLKAGVENAWDSLERASHKIVERFAA
ncbi:MAG: coiled coil domain-containing protein [Pseudomonadota bacterium]